MGYWISNDFGSSLDEYILYSFYPYVLCVIL